MLHCDLFISQIVWNWFLFYFLLPFFRLAKNRSNLYFLSFDFTPYLHFCGKKNHQKDSIGALINTMLRLTSVGGIFTYTVHLQICVIFLLWENWFITKSSFNHNSLNKPPRCIQLCSDSCLAHHILLLVLFRGGTLKSSIFFCLVVLFWAFVEVRLWRFWTRQRCGLLDSWVSHSLAC